MHVLMIPSWYYTKEQPIHGSFFHEHALALKKAGVRIGVLYPEIRQLRSWTPQLFLRNHFQRTSGLEGPLPTCRLHGWNLFPKMMQRQMEAWCYFAKKLLKNYVDVFGKPDLIHAQSSVWAGIAAKRLGEMLGVPYCVTEHASVFMKQEVLGTPWDKCWSTSYIREAFDSAAAVVAVSSALKEKLKVYTSAQVQVIPNLVETSRFKPKKKKQGHFRFLTVSHLIPRKNVSLLLHAFKLLYEQDPEVRLTIGGDGPEKEPLQKLAQVLGIAQKVSFLGSLSREEVKGALQGADVFVLASQHETFGVVCIEAIASGLPVVATRSGGTEDIVTEEVGSLVAMHDAQELCTAMARIKVLASTFDPEQLHQFAEERFGPAAVSKLYVQLYQQILAPK